MGKLKKLGLAGLIASSIVSVTGLGVMLGGGLMSTKYYDENNPITIDSVIKDTKNYINNKIPVASQTQQQKDFLKITPEEIKTITGDKQLGIWKNVGAFNWSYTSINEGPSNADIIDYVKSWTIPEALNKYNIVNVITEIKNKKAPTEAATFTIAQNVDLNEFSAKDAIGKITKQFIINNKDKFFTGEISEINEEADITSVSAVESSPGVLASGVLVTIELAANSWYNSIGELGTTPKTFKINIVGFDMPYQEEYTENYWAYYGSQLSEAGMKNVTINNSQKYLDHLKANANSYKEQKQNQIADNEKQKAQLQTQLDAENAKPAEQQNKQEIERLTAAIKAKEAQIQELKNDLASHEQDLIDMQAEIDELRNKNFPQKVVDAGNLVIAGSTIFGLFLILTISSGILFGLSKKEDK